MTPATAGPRPTGTGVTERFRQSLGGASGFDSDHGPRPAAILHKPERRFAETDEGKQAEAAEHSVASPFKHDHDDDDDSHGLTVMCLLQPATERA